MYRSIKEFYAKNFEYTDIRNGMVAAISNKVEEPVFESQTKTKLGSKDVGPDGPTIAKFIGDFLKKELDIKVRSSCIRSTNRPIHYGNGIYVRSTKWSVPYLRTHSF